MHRILASTIGALLALTSCMRQQPEECLSAIRALIYDDETLEWMAGNMRAMKGQLEEESLNRMLAGLEAEKGVRVG